MSYVTNAVLLFSALEDDSASDTGEHPIVAELNATLKQRMAGATGWFARVDHHAGGTKAFQANAYLAAFNYADIDALVEVVSGMAWERPERVRLLLQSERDDAFRIAIPRA